MALKHTINLAGRGVTALGLNDLQKPKRNQLSPNFFLELQIISQSIDPLFCFNKEFEIVLISGL